MNVQALVAWFTPVRARLVLYGVAAVLVMVLVVKLPSLVSGVFLGAPADRTFDAGVAAVIRRQHEQHRRADSVNVVAKASRFVYVVAKRKATDAVAALPVATVVNSATSSTITIADTLYTIPAPVARYVTGLQAVVAVQGTALVAADSAIRATRDAQVLSDSIAATSDSLSQAVIAHEKGNRPGFFGRVWGAAKVPVAFLSGVALAVLARRAGL